MSEQMVAGRADDGAPQRGVRASRSWRTIATLGLAVACTVLFSACEEENVFEGGGGTGTAPEVTQVQAPSSVTAGDDLNLTISAEGQRLIAELRVEWRAGTGATRDTVVEIDPPAQVVAEQVMIPLQAALSGTELTVSAFAIDESGAESEAQTVVIAIADAQNPEVDIIVPAGPDVSGDTAAVATGATVRVEAQIRDASGIDEVRFVGYAFRGDPELGTDERVVRFEERVVDFPVQGVDTLPTDTLLRRDLVQVGDSSEIVLFVVTATDLFGNVSTDTVPVQVGGPSVAIVRPEGGQTHRQTADLTVRVAIADSASGVQSLSLILAGVIEEVIPIPLNGQPRNDTIDHIIPSAEFTTTGQLTIQARASNASGIFAMTPPTTVTVVDDQEPDVTAPAVQLEVSPLPGLVAPLDRLEQEDTIYVTVGADDQGGVGVTQIGVYVDAGVNSGADTADYVLTHNLATPRTNPDTTFAIAVSDLYEIAAPGAGLAETVSWPDSIDLHLEAYAIDAAGNDAYRQVPEGATASRGYLLAVAGETVRLPFGGIISDAAVDTTPNDERLFLSNYTQNVVDVLDLRTNTFNSVLVGAQPWGLFLDNSGDTLMVANSGGTNISKVPLRVVPLREDGSARIFTPEVVLYDIEITLDEQLRETYTGVAIGFSDRPQFLAQSRPNGEILYSTVPTPSAQDGTIRLLHRDPTWDDYDTDLLYPGGDPADEEQESHVVIADADTVVIASYPTADSIIIYDHVRGFQDMEISGIGTPVEAAAEVQAQGGDATVFAGGYDPDGVGLQDTTFVAASGDRQWIAFGEGATAPVGRIILWNSSIGQSSTVQITDLIHNASEVVTGVGLNENGSLGVARGDFGVYYFNNDLRLQGIYAEDINPGGYGAALHPSHDATFDLSDPNSLSFVGTAERAIRVIDTNHFFARGDLPVKNPIVGPLRATLPIAGIDNVGLTCGGASPDPNCVVVRLFGVTSSGGGLPDGVVVVRVREKDLQ